MSSNEPELGVRVGTTPDGWALMRDPDGTEWINYSTPEEDEEEERHYLLYCALAPQLIEGLGELYVSQRYGDGRESIERQAGALYELIDEALEGDYSLASTMLLYALHGRAVEHANARTAAPDSPAALEGTQP